MSDTTSQQVVQGSENIFSNTGNVNVSHNYYFSDTQPSKDLLNQIEVLRQSLIEQSEQRYLHHSELVIGPRPKSALIFINREREIAGLRYALDTQQKQIIVINGRAGMGKTALAARILDEFELHLSPNRQNDKTLNGIVCFNAQGGGLGLDSLYSQMKQMLRGQRFVDLENLWQDKQTTVEDKARYLLSCLGQGRYLILIDNFEDVLSEDGQPKDLGINAFLTAGLTIAHQSQILITSRQVPILRKGIVGLKQIHLRHGLPLHEATKFLQELDVDEEAGLRNAKYEILEELAKRTDGIPRALEYIYAALVSDQTIAPDDLLNDESLWQEGVIGALQQESYRRLIDPTARYLISGLAVYNQPVPVEALRFLLSDDSENIQSVLRQLVNGAFISFDRKTKNYTLHPLDSDYLYRLLSPEERVVLHHRAADYFFRLRLPQDHWHSLVDLAPQLREYKHRIQAGQYEAAAQLVGEVETYFELWAQILYWRDMREQLVDKLADHKLAIINLRQLGKIFDILGEVQKSLYYYQQTLISAKAINDDSILAACYNELGKAYSRAGERELGIVHYEQAIDIVKKIDDKKQESDCLNGLAGIYSGMGKFPLAIEYYNQGLNIAREIRYKEGEIVALSGLLYPYRDTGNIQKAIECVQQAVEISKEMDNKLAEAENLRDLGYLYGMIGETQKETDCHEQALVIARKIGNRKLEAEYLFNQSVEYRDEGQPEKAIECLEKAFKLAREIGDRRLEAGCLDFLGFVYGTLGLGEYQKELEYHQRALDVVREIGNRIAETNTLNNIANTYNRLGDIERAIEFHQKGLAISREVNYWHLECLHLENLGDIYLKLEDIQQAIEYFQQSLTVSKKVGEKRYEASSLRHLGIAYYHSGAFQKSVKYINEVMEIVEDFRHKKIATSSLQYDLACALVLVGKIEEALVYVRRALDVNATKYYKKALTDPDFDAIRDVKEFQDLLAEFERVKSRFDEKRGAEDCR